MPERRSLRQRAAEAERKVVVRRVPDVSKGRGFDPLAPHLDGLARIMITRVPMVNSETGEVVTTHHVDYFNCSNAQEAADLYREGAVAVKNMVERNERPEPL
jgi:hypothetical protein